MNLEVQLLLANQYIPHGHCYLWQTPLVGLHVAADALIAIAYYSIPICLICFARQVQGLPFKGVFMLFGAFIIACGTTHLAEIWTLWHPNYWIYGILKAITALISLYTALSLIPLIPKALHLPSPEQISSLNQQLSEQVLISEDAKQQLHQLNQELEQRIAEKTAALVRANQDLQSSTKFKEKITDLAPNILYIYDLNSNSNVYCNPFINKLLGYSQLEILNFKTNIIEALIHPEDLIRVKQHFESCLEIEDDKYLEIEYRIRDSQGKWHWLQDKSAIFSRNQVGEPDQILGIAQDITEAKETQLRNQELTQKLESQVLALAKNNQARIKLAEMNEFIQACVSLEEAQNIIGELLQPLFPDSSGAVYLINDNQIFLKAIATWGTPTSKEYFEPKECWGIRRSNLHQANSPKLHCNHTDSHGDLGLTLCFPMIAKGETIGVLYFSFKADYTLEQSVKDLAETVAQNLAITFANLKLQQKLRFQSLRDPLTNLFNRRYLLEFLDNELDRAQRQQHTVSVILLDIDYFKRFNDVYGHSAGDLVLSQVGAYLLSEIRQYDIACRYGGEEMLIVMPGAVAKDAAIRAEGIRAGVKKLQLEHEGKKLDSISVSIGVSSFPNDGSNVKSLIDAADNALYRAKEAGRDRVVSFTKTS
ncbi:MAG: diguanylate cyclase [Cyanobacteria bacterium J06621_8]